MGWRATKPISGRLASIITAMATTTAIIMMLKSCTMPTAVITESSENTASSTTICRITCQNTACRLLPGVVAGAAFHALVQFHGALEQQEQAAQYQDQVAT